MAWPPRPSETSSVEVTKAPGRPPDRAFSLSGNARRPLGRAKNADEFARRLRGKNNRKPQGLPKGNARRPLGRAKNADAFARRLRGKNKDEKLRHQPVAAGLGDQDLGVGRVALDLLAQAVNVGFQRVGGDAGVVAPDLVQ